MQPAYHMTLCTYIPLPLPPPFFSISFLIPTPSRLLHSPPPLDPSPLATGPAHQALGADAIPAPQQGRHVDVEGGIDFRVRQQLVDGLEGRDDRVRGRPGRFQQVETDFTRLGLEMVSFLG